MKKFLLAILIIIAGFGVWWYLVHGTLPQPAQLEQVVQKASEAITEATGKISTPPPLRITQQAPSSTLTQAGVLFWTNSNRQADGKATLTLNEKLNSAASAKLVDLFAKQYFEHVSPTGVGPSDLAKSAGYVYISVGENLALGNFTDDKALVQAWMDSPGHRANILGDYTEIGIAVGKGTYEGHTTWIAVQEFGKPLTACPTISASLKAKIQTDKATLAQMQDQADQKKAQIETTPKPKTREEVDAYNAQVDEYNAIVRQINLLTQTVQGEITVYNGQVQAFNACAGAS